MSTRERPRWRPGPDVWVAIVLLAASLFFFVHLWTTPSPGGVAPTTLPMAVAAAMTLLALLLLAFAVTGRTSALSGDRDGARTAGRWRVAALIGWTALDVALMPWFGYVLTTAVYVGGLALLFGNRRALSILALVVLMPVALMLFFERFMLVLLPSARLFE